MKLHLRDKDPGVVSAWREVFGDRPDVTISHGDILELEGDAIVSPANSFGWMDGGIDLAYRERFGPAIEQRLQGFIRAHFGELPVGQAVAFDTNDTRIRTMIAAPTMRIPGPVRGTVNAYLALRAALWLAVKRSHGTILCPGLCTLTGGMPPMQAAVQMYYAWQTVAGRDPRFVPPLRPATVAAMHRDMLVPR